LFNGVDEQVNVLHLIVTNGGTSPENDVLNDVHDFLEAAYGELVPGIASVLDHGGASVFNVTAHGPIGEVSPIAALNGGATGQCLPPQVAALLVLPTAVSRVQGRVYIPTTAEGYNDGGLVELAYRAFIVDFGDYLTTTYVGAAGNSLRYRVVGAHGNLVPTSAFVVPRFRTQRRRTSGRGS